MIFNERQYRITAKQVAQLYDALRSTDSDRGTPEWLSQAQRNGLQSEIDELESQMKEYELLRSGKVTVKTVSDLAQLPSMLIRARIASGMTQKDLAVRLGVAEQQVQRYEASEYSGANLSRLVEVSRIVGLKVEESWGDSADRGGGALYVWEDSGMLDFTKFPAKEMMKRKWIQPRHGEDLAATVREFFLTSAGERYATALHRKKVHGANLPDEYSLLAWQARVLSVARSTLSNGRIGEFKRKGEWVRTISQVSSHQSAPLKAAQLLAKNGIILVIEEHLPGTYLDGAAMMLDSGNPVVALTLRYDRLDHFWFVLLHEIGHVYLHIADNLEMDFFDEQDGDSEDQIEREADAYASEALIPEEKWESCLSRFTTTVDAVIADSERLGIHPSIIAGRIRREEGNYRILSGLVGQNEVRSLFRSSG